MLQLGFASKQFASAVVFAGLLVMGNPAQAADPLGPFTGGLLGKIVDSKGVPQMGATIQVYNKYQRFIGRTFSAPDGRFAFATLPADSYSIRVSLDSFLPVSREKIAVKAGLDSVLDVHLATLFSNIEISYTLPTGAMSDDWKWVLRSSPATRPITRLLPDDAEDPPSPQPKPRVFSGTHAMLAVSGGDGLIASDDIGVDFGTQFALSTNILGKNQLQLAGSFGQPAEFGPNAIALCAIYTRTENTPLGASPEVTLTAAQIGGAVSGLTSAGSAADPVPGSPGQVLRSMSISFYQTADPLDNMHVEFGSTAESVDFVQHASRISPFARLTVDLGSLGSLIAAYSDGGRPDELTAHQQYQSANQESVNDPGDNLSAAVNSLSRMPQISAANGRLELQRTQNYELGYSKAESSRLWAVSAFYEAVSNGRLNVAGDVSALNTGDLFSDGLSPLSTYNIGSYRRPGLVASVTQHVGHNLDVAAAYGREGSFLVSSINNPSSWSGSRFLGDRQSNLASLSANTRLRGLGTRISTDYGWLPPGVVLPRHVFTTQSINMAPGLNVYIRQPVPSFFGLPGHLEITADLRNLLAQGYVPVNMADGHTLLIVEAPRAIRGGLSFVF